MKSRLWETLEKKDTISSTNKLQRKKRTVSRLKETYGRVGNITKLVLRNEHLSDKLIKKIKK